MEDANIHIKLVKESIDFQQGGEPYKALKIGKHSEETFYGIPINDGTNIDEIDIVLQSNKELQIGTDYAIVDDGMNEWLGDLRLESKVPYFFRSTLQMDEDFTLTITEPEMDWLIINNQIAHMI